MRHCILYKEFSLVCHDLNSILHVIFHKCPGAACPLDPPSTASCPWALVGHQQTFCPGFRLPNVGSPVIATNTALISCYNYTHYTDWLL